MNPLIEAILAERGVITVAEVPGLKTALMRLKSDGVLDNPLPGTYVSAGPVVGEAWLRTVSAWAAPSGVLHGRSAASLWLPSLASGVAFLAHPSLRSRRGVVVSRRRIPSEHVGERDGLRIATPAYAAAELAAVDDGRAICEALRMGLADADALDAALTALSGTSGQAERRRVVVAARGNPWSYAELRLQRILAEGGLTDWVANRPLSLGGREVWPDIRFRARKLIIEFDGREVHNNPSQFLSDRERVNLLEAHGYHVLRFGWEHLAQPGYVLATVRAALRMASPL